MSSVLTAVFKATIGLIVNKGRDEAAEKLKEGDVTEQKFRSLIVREIDDIKSKLDGLSRKDLLASISFFKEGIEILCRVFENAFVSRNAVMPLLEQTEVITNTGDSKDSAAAAFFALTERKTELELARLDEPTLRLLAAAKKRFEDARREATRAFNNESLKLPDRLLAMKYRVMATILETIDTYLDAFPACQTSVSELHALPEVQKNFTVQVEKGFMSRFGKDDRIDIISTVCQINHVIYDVFRSRRKGDDWAYIEIREDNIDPLRDMRIAKVLRNVDLEHYCLPWCFGDDGKEVEGRLYKPYGIATNSKGDFIISEHNIGEVKVFDSHTNFLYSLDHPNFYLTEREVLGARTIDVATDQEDSIYMLIGSTKESYAIVIVIDKHGELSNTFRLEHDDCTDLRSLAINDNKMMVIFSKYMVHIYTGGDLYRSINLDEFDKPDKPYSNKKYICDGAAGCNRVFVSVYQSGCRSRLHVFSILGVHLRVIYVNISQLSQPKLAFHRGKRHLFMVTGYNVKRVSIFTQDCDLVSSMKLCGPDGRGFDNGGLAVTPDAHIAITNDKWGVLQFKTTSSSRTKVFPTLKLTC